MVDEGLHVIQLNGKQLVLLFTASPVAAVVIFLCGVTVDRGVHTQRRFGIGKYSTRLEGEAVAARLENEAQFQSWITR